MRDGWMATGTGVGEVEVKSRDQDFQPTGVFRRQTISSIHKSPFSRTSWRTEFASTWLGSRIYVHDGGSGDIPSSR